jgi:hypothetical protein
LRLAKADGNSSISPPKAILAAPLAPS